MLVSADDSDLPDLLRAATGGQPAYAAIDAIGSDVLGAVVSVVRDNGTVILYGAMSGIKASAGPAPLWPGASPRGRPHPRTLPPILQPPSRPAPLPLSALLLPAPLAPSSCPCLA